MLYKIQHNFSENVLKNSVKHDKMKVVQSKYKNGQTKMYLKNQEAKMNSRFRRQIGNF